MLGIKKKKLQIGLTSFCVLTLCIGTAHCFIPSVRQNDIMAKLYSKVYDPLQRNDIEQLHELVDYVNTLTEGNDKLVYVDASGVILNASIFEALNKPYGQNPLRNMLWTSDVDLRDGFPAGFLAADIIITTKPVELHLAEGTQEVVRFLSQEIANPQSCIGRHFVKDSHSFSLDNDVKAYIYVKESEFQEEDLIYLAEYYTNLYPGYESLFADRILGTSDN